MDCTGLIKVISSLSMHSYSSLFVESALSSKHSIGQVSLELFHLAEQGTFKLIKAVSSTLLLSTSEEAATCVW